MTTLADYVDEVRSSVEDRGDTVTDNQTGDGTTTIFKLSSFPIKTNSELSPSGTLTVNGVVQTQGTNYTINYDTGECKFVTAPPNTQAIVVQYLKVYWHDERLISGVNAGIREMFKDGAYYRGELYIQCQALKYDYDLSNTTDVPAASAFTDFTLPADYNPAQARADIVKAQTKVNYGEYHRYGANQAFFPFYNFTRTTLRNFHIDGDPTPSDAIKLTYSAPFPALVNMSDTSTVPDELFMAPVWFALSVLLEKKEAKRVRYDQYSAMQNANAIPPGTQPQTAADFLMRYKDLMDGGMRPQPMKQRRRRQSWQQLGTIR
jgi:hypothetical protein